MRGVQALYDGSPIAIDGIGGDAERALHRAL